MALVVVGGQTKDIGKTTLVCQIIRQFVFARWTAAKITSHIYDAEDCKSIASGRGWKICEQRLRDSNADTARYLKVGAIRSLLVCAESGSLEKACSAFKNELSGTANVIVESTAAVPLLAPDLFLLLTNPTSADFKAAAAKQLARADALVSVEAKSIEAAGRAEEIPMFQSFEDRLDPALAKMIDRVCELPARRASRKV
jgi:hypothetical protein